MLDYRTKCMCQRSESVLEKLKQLPRTNQNHHLFAQETSSKKVDPAPFVHL